MPFSDDLYELTPELHGQLGTGSTSPDYSARPLTVSLPLRGIVGGFVTATATAAGHYHSLALGSDGNTYAWGDNRYGELGASRTSPHHSATPVAVGLPAGIRATAIAARDGFSLALSTPVGNPFAVLLYRGDALALAGESLSFGLGNQTCTPAQPTDKSGVASCMLAPVPQTLGPAVVQVNFAGDSGISPTGPLAGGLPPASTQARITIVPASGPLTLGVGALLHLAGSYKGTVRVGKDATLVLLTQAAVRGDVLSSGTLQLEQGSQVQHDVVTLGGTLSLDGAAAGHDLASTNTALALSGASSLGHDLTVHGGTAVLQGIRVQHDLVVRDALPPGGASVTNSTAGHDAICENNHPFAGTGNTAGHQNSCNGSNL